MEEGKNGCSKGRLWCPEKTQRPKLRQESGLRPQPARTSPVGSLLLANSCAQCAWTSVSTLLALMGASGLHPVLTSTIEWPGSGKIGGFFWPYYIIAYHAISDASLPPSPDWASVGGNQPCHLCDPPPHFRIRYRNSSKYLLYENWILSPSKWFKMLQNILHLLQKGRTREEIAHVHESD